MRRTIEYEGAAGGIMVIKEGGMKTTNEARRMIQLNLRMLLVLFMSPLPSRGSGGRSGL